MQHKATGMSKELESTLDTTKSQLEKIKSELPAASSALAAINAKLHKTEKHLF